MKNISFENKCSLELEADTDYTCKGGNLSNLFYTGVPYDSVYSIHFNGITVGIVYISFVEQSSLFVNWIEIMTPFRSKGILRHVFDLLKLFNVSSIKLSCESKYLSKYKSLGFKEIDYDAITELYHLEVQCG